MELPPSWKHQKDALRRQAEANRRDQPDKDALSRVICAKFASLSEYAAAGTVLCYVGVRHEVRTHPFLPQVLQQGKRLVVPCCAGDELELFALEDLEELSAAAFGLLEPGPAVRNRTDRKVALPQVDLIMVPGVAFDRQGGRLGHGKGYYDRLLRHARPETPLVALAFECQLFPEVPMRPHDIFMDLVITEKAIYQGQGRAAVSETHLRE